LRSSIFLKSNGCLTGTPRALPNPWSLSPAPFQATGPHPHTHVHVLLVPNTGKAKGRPAPPAFREHGTPPYCQLTFAGRWIEITSSELRNIEDKTR